MSLSKNKQLCDDDLRNGFKNGFNNLQELNVSYSNITGSCFAEFRASGKKRLVIQGDVVTTHNKRVVVCLELSLIF